MACLSCQTSSVALRPGLVKPIEASRQVGAQPAAAAPTRFSDCWLHGRSDRDADIFGYISGPSESSPGARWPDPAL